MGCLDALDLLTVCVEAGSGLDQAIARTTEDLNIPHPELSDELGRSRPRFGPVFHVHKR